jgi:DNA-binding transcriptional ArsR family regulator
MEGRRSAALVLVVLVLVSGVTASVGAATAPPGEDTLDDGENTTDGTTNTTDTVDGTSETADTVEETTDSDTTDDGTTDGETGETTDDGTTDSVEDATSGDDTSVTDGETGSDDQSVTGDGAVTDDETVTNAVTSAESTTGEATDEVTDAVATVDEATGASDTVRSATNATAQTFDETTDALSETLAVDSTTSVGLTDGGSATNGESATRGSSAAESATAQRESRGWSRERRRAAGDDVAASSARATSDDRPAGGERSAPHRLPLSEGVTVTTAFVAGMVAVARPPVVTQSGASHLRAMASRRLSAGFDDLRRFLGLLGYSRYDDSDPLDHDARAALYDAVQAQPGVYLSELSERAGVNLSTARHHVRVLEDENLVTSAKPRGKRRYYPSTAEDFELPAALSEPATAAVLEALAELGDAHVGLLADELDRDPSTVSHHLQRLADDGLVERERRGRAVVNRLADPVADAIGGREPAVADD